MSKNMSSINVDVITYEYLLKARQETWENAEVIFKLFGPISLDDKSGERGKKYRTWYKNTSQEVSNHNFPVTNSGCGRSDGSSNGKMFFQLDYDKMINARVLLSDINSDTNVNKNSFFNELHSQSPALSMNTSPAKGVFTNVHSPSDRPQGGDGNGCTVCHKKFTCKSSLARHLRTHTGEKPFSCPQCEKKFSQSSNLKGHMLVHSGIKAFSCDICYKVFAHKSTLIPHRRTHTGEKPFKCTECNAMFSFQGEMNRHKRTHTGETPYQCEICKRKFTDLSSLKTHILIHSEEKPFACTYANCKKTFKRKNSLQQHIRSHTREKPFACPVCKKTFTQKRDCKRHATRCSVKMNVVF